MKNNSNKKLPMLQHRNRHALTHYLIKTDIFTCNDMALFSWLAFYCISTLYLSKCLEVIWYFHKLKIRFYLFIIYFWHATRLVGS